jgi:hypothetical protein
LECCNTPIISPICKLNLLILICIRQKLTLCKHLLLFQWQLSGWRIERSEIGEINLKNRRSQLNATKSMKLILLFKDLRYYFRPHGISSHCVQRN